MEYAITAGIKGKLYKFPWILISPSHKSVLMGIESIAEGTRAKFGLFMGDYGYRLPDAEIVVPQSINLDEFAAWPSLIKQLEQADGAV